jgi:hypothetical protein
MKYAGQVQGALERLDQSLAKLYTLVKRGQNKEAIHFMKEGELKDRYDELQNMITIAGGPGTTGAMGTSQTGTF